MVKKNDFTIIVSYYLKKHKNKKFIGRAVIESNQKGILKIISIDSILFYYFDHFNSKRNVAPSNVS